MGVIRVCEKERWVSREGVNEGAGSLCNMRREPDVKDNNKISQSSAPLPVGRNHTRHKTTHCASCSDPAMLQDVPCPRHQREWPWDGAIWNAWIEGVKGLSGGRGLVS